MLCMQRCVNNPCRISVHPLDLDERLVGVCVTSLCSMKNLLLIGDSAKIVWLVAFQVRRLRLFYVSLMNERFVGGSV